MKCAIVLLLVSSAAVVVNVEAFRLRAARSAQNAYGDEPFLPVEATSAAPVDVVDAATTAASELAATEAAPVVEGSGAEEEEEKVTVPAATEAETTTTAAPTAAEYAPAEVAQEPATETPKVEASGYRL